MSSNDNPEEQKEKHPQSTSLYNAFLAPNEALRQALQELEPEIERKTKESLQNVKDACKDYLEWRRSRPPANRNRSVPISDNVMYHITKLRNFANNPENTPERVQQRVLEDLRAMFPRPVAVEEVKADRGDRTDKNQAAGQAQMLKKEDDETSEPPSSDQSS